MRTCFLCSRSVCLFTTYFFFFFGYCSILTMSLNTHSEMPSGGYLCFPDILHQTIRSTVYKACLQGANKSNGSQEMCGLTRGRLKTLMVSSSSAVCFSERGEVSVGGKHRHAHSNPCLFNFLPSLAGLVGTWACFHSCIQLHL